jgi:hypothetical protein
LSPSASDNPAAPYELTTSLVNKKFYNASEGSDLALTSGDAQSGDYLVIEIGFRSATTTTRAIALRYGDGDGSNDLPEDSTSTNDYNPWVEFSGTISLLSDTAYNVGNENLFFSPGNWGKNGTSYAQSVNPGAYIKTKINGTGFKFTADFTAFRALGYAQNRYPWVGWRVNGGEYTRQQVSNGADVQEFTVATGLSYGNYDIEVYFDAQGAGNVWTAPANYLRVTGVLVEMGELIAPTLKTHRWLVYGDSICYGVNKFGITYLPDISSSWDTFGLQLGDEFDAEVGVIGFAAQSWHIPGPAAATVPAFHIAGGVNTWGHLWDGVSRSFEGIDKVIITTGTNESESAETVEADIEDFLSDFRAANAGIPLLLFSPVMDTLRQVTIDAFEDYQAGANDELTTFFEIPTTEQVSIELGLWDDETHTYTYDGGHPNQAGHDEIARFLIEFIEGGPVTVVPEVATVRAVGIDPVVILGAITITPGIVTVRAVGIDPTVILGITITPEPATVRAVGIDPTVILGAITITPGIVTVRAVGIDPTVILGITIMPAPATVRAVGIDPVVILGAITITPGIVTVRAVGIDPTVYMEALPIGPLGEDDTPGLIIYLLAHAIYAELTEAGLGVGLQEPSESNAEWWGSYLFG